MSRQIKIARAQFRGDPGLFGFIGGLAKKVAGVAGSILPGPLGAAAKGISRLIPGGGGRNGQPAPPVTRTVNFPMLNQTLARRLPTMARQLAPQIQIGSPGGFQTQIDVTGVRAGGGGPADGTVVQRDDVLVAGCLPGFRPNKSAYYETSPAGGVIYHPPGTKCVKSRRRNPANARATDRAISRITSAKRLARKLGRITIRKECD